MGKGTLLEYTDAVFGFCVEKIPGKGEDSWCYSFNEQAGLLGVFDGCGGLGAATYEKLQNHSGAYLASRAVSAATQRWFHAFGGGTVDKDNLKAQMLDTLSVCVSTADQVQAKLRGSMVRLMPTTAAIWLLEKRGTKIYGTSVSAGDSRTYLLDKHGLAQVSVDDLAGEDAMSNLYHDGAMTNVISADGDFTLSAASYELSGPCVLFSATDGCFGYLKSPMEFEYLLLESLAAAQSIDQWHNQLMSAINEVAGDDQTLAVAVLGYRSFGRLQQSMKNRLQTLKEMLAGIGEDIGLRQALWEHYKHGYYRLAKGGIPRCE